MTEERKVFKNSKLQALSESGWREPDFDTSTNEISDIKKALAQSAATLPQAAKECVELVCSCLEMGFKPSDPDQPFQPLWVFDNRRSIIPADLDEEHLAIVEFFARKSKHPIVRGICFDILWLRKKDHKAALSAAEDYAKVASLAATDDFDEVHESIQFAKRAAVIWRQLGGKDTELGKKIGESFKQCVRLDSDEPKNYIRVKAVTAAIEFGQEENCGIHINKLYAFSNEAAKQNDFEKARDYLELALKLAKRAKSEDLEKQLKDDLKALYLEEMKVMRSAGADAFIMEGLVSRTIQYLRSIGDKALIEDLHRELIDIQKEIPHKLKGQEFSVDATEDVKHLLAQIGETPSGNAIIALAGLGVPPSKNQIFALAKEQAKDSPLMYMIPAAYVDGDGRVVGREGSGEGGEDDIIERAAQVQMVFHFGRIDTLVNAGLSEIRKRNDFYDDVFDDLLSSNPFVPKDHLAIFRKGLIAGLHRDWITSALLLTPQVENSIRHVLEGAGIISTKLDAKMIQERKGYSFLLGDEKATAYLGEDLVFFLGSLYDFGQNLRHDVAHGLISSGRAMGLGPAVWASTLNLIVKCKRLRLGLPRKPKEDAPPSDLAPPTQTPEGG